MNELSVSFHKIQIKKKGLPIWEKALYNRLIKNQMSFRTTIPREIELNRRIYERKI